MSSNHFNEYGTSVVGLLITCGAGSGLLWPAIKEVARVTHDGDYHIAANAITSIL